ncbi:MAG: cob(I)yrinic acid a,c-diamide adenosyltransferase [Firmicutes bacterium]|nr:cob(I)yrinic acid a,c-diamide adenosyltransferase [Bacillota bacterium]
MESNIYVYYGEGKGKTTMALGRGFKAVSNGEEVIMVRFLQPGAKYDEEYFYEKLGEEFKVFAFGSDKEEEGARSETEVKNGFNFSKKLIDTDGCDLLIFDGITDAVERGIIPREDLLELLKSKTYSMDIVVMGEHLIDGLFETADFVYCISTEKEPED